MILTDYANLKKGGDEILKNLLWNYWANLNQTAEIDKSS
jgi:hypothetical protein